MSPLSLPDSARWTLRWPDGRIATTTLTFQPDGTLAGFSDMADRRWALREGRLALSDRQGQLEALAATGWSEGVERLAMMHPDRGETPAFELLQVRGESLAEGLRRELRDHRAFGGRFAGAEPGFTLPDLSAHVMVPVSEDTRPQLAALGITVVGSPARENRIVLDPAMTPTKLEINYNLKGAFNTILLGGKSLLSGKISFESSENVVVVGDSPHRSAINATFRYHAGGLALGAGGSCATANIWIEGPGRCIQVGDGYMFSWGVWLRTADSHAIIDLKAASVMNEPESIGIGDYVWIGQEAMIMPGSTIGRGSIVGARSIVTRDVPAFSVAAGSPAKVVRNDVSWSRLARPSPAQIGEIVARWTPEAET